MAPSFIRKIQKILEKPVPPAHILERNIQVVIPWHQQIWRALRPPSAVGSKGSQLSAVQRRMLKILIVTLVVLGGAGAALKYRSDAPFRAQRAFDEGMTLLGPSNFKGAIAKFTESIEIHETPAAYLERGNAERNLGQSDRALEDLARAIQLDPASPNPYVARGTFYRLAGDYPRAMADLTQALQLGPTVDAYVQRGEARHALGQYAEAITDFTEAINLRREAPYVYLARSASKQAMGDEAGAEEDRRIAKGLQPAPTDR